MNLFAASPERVRRGMLFATFCALAAATAAFVIGRADWATEELGRAAPLLLLLGVAFGALVIRYSAAGVPILVGFIYLNLSETLVRYHAFPSLLQLLVIGLAVAAWLKSDTEPLSVLAQQRLLILAAIYVLVVFVSTSWALDRHLADDRFSQILRAFVLFVLATLLMRTRQRMLQGIAALIGAATAIGLLILFQAVTGQFGNDFGGLARVKDAHIYGEVFRARVAGPNGDPNFFARSLLLAIPPAVLFAFQAPRRWQRRAALGATLVIGATLALTYSRGAMIALAVMTLMLLQELHVRWQTTVKAAVAGLVLLVLLPANVTRRFITIEEFLPGAEEPLHPDSSFEERRMLMSVAWVMFGANPIGGVGIANYTSRYDDYVGATSSVFRQYGDGPNLHYPHNLFLEIAAETGVLGLAAFGALLIGAWFGLSRAYHTFRETDAELSIAAAALRISLVGFLIASLFLHLAEPRTLFLIFAFAATLERLALRGRDVGA